MTSKHKRLVIRIVSQALVFPLRSMFRLLPWTPSYWASDKMASAAFHLFSGRRRSVLGRLNWIYGEELSTTERESICRDWFRNLFSTVMEGLKLSRATLPRLGDRINLEGERNLREALAQGRGVILVTAHFGNLEYLAALLCQKGYPLNVLASPDETGVRTRLHSLYGLKDILMGDRGSRGVLHVLKRGEVLLLVIDWNQTPRPIQVDFLGKSTPIPRGAAVLASRFGAPVLFACIVRQADRTHRLTIHGAFTLIRTGTVENDIEANMRQFIRPLEPYVRKFPEQWY